jgi:hypothetical protein
VAQSSRVEKIRYQSREVSVFDPGMDADGFFPKGSARVCIAGPPEQQCYTAPDGFGREPAVELVQLERDKPALFFSVASGGVSGSAICFALLGAGQGKELQNLFLSVGKVSNQSEHEFWSVPDVSSAPIFVTADFVWGPNEAHYSPHRYRVSAYVYRTSDLLDDRMYYLEDEYMTVRQYGEDAGGRILSTEKAEVLARLQRAKAEFRRSGGTAY